MKQKIIARLALVTVALALSLLVIRRDGLANVAPCEMTPGCVSSNTVVRGTFTTVHYGFPVAYRETKIFRPTKNADYQEMRLTQQGVSVSTIILDVIFWYALLELLWRVRTTIMHTVRRRYETEQPSPAAEDIPPVRKK